MQESRLVLKTACKTATNPTVHPETTNAPSLAMNEMIDTTTDLEAETVICHQDAAHTRIDRLPSEAKKKLSSTATMSQHAITPQDSSVQLSIATATKDEAMIQISTNEAAVPGDVVAAEAEDEANLASRREMSPRGIIRPLDPRLRMEDRSGIARALSEVGKEVCDTPRNILLHDA